MDALGAAHAKSVLHRDVKPENIMLTPVEDDYDRLRLIDFGIAKVGQSQLAPETEISRAIGTILYISPEQLLGASDLTPAADIYSAAIVTYELLTGSLPFKPKTMPEMYLLQQQGVQLMPRRLRRDVPVEAERLLLSALEFDAAKRPQNARVFGRELARALRVDERDVEPASVKDDEFLHSIKTQYYPTINVMPAPETPVIRPLSTVAQVPDPTAPEPVRESVIESGPEPTQEPPPVSLRPRWLMWSGLAAGLVIALMVGTLGIFLYLERTENPAQANPVLPETGAKSHSVDLTSFLMVQKMRDRKEYESPFKSAGQVALEKGYKFTFNVQSSAAGYIYIFSEGPADDGTTEYGVLFPTTKGRADPRINASQTITTGSNTISGGKGNEYIWVVWTKESNADLENAAHSIDQIGRVTGSGLDALKSFLLKNANNPREMPSYTNDETRLIKGIGDIVVDKFELKHV